MRSRRSRRRAGISIAIAAAALALLVFCALASGSEQVVYYFGGAEGSGSLGGEFNSPRDVAVNATGAGPAEAGDIYVADEANNRIQRFDSEGHFVSAWGADVVSAGGAGDAGDAAAKKFEICAVASQCQAGAASGGNESASSDGSLSRPQAVAVDEDTGEVYVSDRNNRRVDVYEGDGTFVRSFGWAVDETTAGSGYEVCPAAHACRAGEGGSGAGQYGNGGVSGAWGIAVSPPDGEASTGEVYLADSGNRRVDTFALDGASPSSFGSAATFESNQPRKLAVDSRGVVYASNSKNEGEIERYDSEGANGGGAVFLAPLTAADSSPAGPLLAGPATIATSGLAVAPDSDGAGPEADVLYVLRDPSSGPTVVQQFGPVNEPGLTAPPSAADEAHGEDAGFAAVSGLGLDRASGRLLVSTANQEVGGLPKGHRVFILGSTLPYPSATIEGVSAVGAHAATVNGAVNPNGSPGGLADGFHTSYRVAYKRAADSEFAQSAEIDAGNGSSDVAVSMRLASLQPGTAYEAKILATRPLGAGSAETAPVAFSTPAAGAEVGTPAATAGIEAGEARAALYGQVYPNGEASTYRFEYGTTTAYGSVAPEPDGAVGSANSNVGVAQSLSGLAPDTTYHFRIFAENATGSAYSPDVTFTTPPLSPPGGCPNEARRVEQGATALPDCRAYEKVTPDKEGSAALAGTESPAPGQVPFRAARGGGAFLYPLQGGLASSTAGGYLRLQASRGAGGWSSAQVSAPALVEPPEVGGFFTPPSLLRDVSPDLSCAVVETYSPLTADTPPLDVEEGIFNLYRRDAGGSWTLITNRVPLNPEFVGQAIKYYGNFEASDDCRHVFFTSSYEFIAGASGLYEWDEGTLRDAGVRPDGSVGPAMVSAAAAAPGGEVAPNSTGRWNAVSPDGSRSFFTAISDEGPDAGTPAVFMRENGGEEVVDVSQSQTAVPTVGARFEAASPDGSMVFFRANHGIAASSSAGPTGEACGPQNGETQSSNTPSIEAKPCDLYAYDVASGELSDLSADPNAVDPIGAAIQGTIAVSDDGSRVYFAALGQLLPGMGNTYAENTAGEGSANVYLADEGSLAYVATLSRADLFYGGSTGLAGTAAMRRPFRWNVKASADGRRLAFESGADIAGYDPAGRRAIYLYSADTGALSCASCPLDGSPSLVAENGRVDARFGAPQMLPASNSLRPHAPEALSADGGRLFFTSPDALSPGAVAGERNVYEWEGGQVRFLAIGEVAGSESPIPELGGFLEAGANGEDAYVATSERYVPGDRDFVSDVYDVRVNGGFKPEAAPAPCDVAASACQGPPSPEPAAAKAGSAALAGEGNPPGGGKRSSCGAPARRAKALSARAKRLARKARRTSRHSHRKAARLNRRAHRLARRARGLGKQARRCRRRGGASKQSRSGSSAPRAKTKHLRSNRNGRAGK